VVSVFVKPSELAGLLDKSIVVDLRRYPDYRAGHIPKAVSIPFHYFNTLNGLAFYPPTGEDLQKLSTRLCVVIAEPMILYDEGRCSTACRAAYTLELLGVKAKVLEGGFEKWSNQGLPVEKDGTHHTKPCSRMLNYVKKPIDKNDVINIIRDGGSILVDTRHPTQYRASRIPSSVNIPWHLFFSEEGSLSLSNGWWRFVEEVLGKPRGVKVVTYCDEGRNSSLVMYMLRMAGFEAECYLPSFNDWRSDPELPKERG